MTKNLALIANQYDHDGVDIYFLGGEKFGLQLKVGPVTVVPMYVMLTVVLRQRTAWRNTSKTCEWTPWTTAKRNWLKVWGTFLGNTWTRWWRGTQASRNATSL